MSWVRYQRKEAKHRRPVLAIVFIAAGLIMALIAGWLFIHDRKTIPKPPLETVKSSATPAPSSVKPTKKAVDTYSVAPTLPKFLTIPAIDVNQARIIQLGLTKDNQIAVPGNIYDTGWYNQSSKPGESGAMFIYGHVSSWTANGVFYNLKKLKPGDTATITNGANTVYTYRVIKTQTYSYNAVDMNSVLSPVDNQPGLNLMTCTGTVIKGTSEFSQRLVVFMSLVS